MDLNDYQDATSETAIFPDEIPEDVPAEVVYTSMGLVGEAGEVAEKAKKAVREDDLSYLRDLPAEVGDVMWYTAQLLAMLDEHVDGVETSMDDAARENLAKLLDRQERNVLTGEGDNR